MASLENRTPMQNDTVTVEGRTGRFAVIGIDAIDKTVEGRATFAPFGVLIAPWTTLSYVGTVLRRRAVFPLRTAPRRLMGSHGEDSVPDIQYEWGYCTMVQAPAAIRRLP